jgi:hypothetical protein
MTPEVAGNDGRGERKSNKSEPQPACNKALKTIWSATTTQEDACGAELCDSQANQRIGSPGVALEPNARSNAH